MSNSVALKLVESPAFYSRDIEMPLDVPGNELSHSLHYSVQLPGSVTPCLSSFFISKFSRKGQVVLDPFCSSGNIVLEAALLGRIVKASDIDPLSLIVTHTKLNPSDITEVTLKLQKINLKRPVDLSNYRQTFSAFYDIDTYRELVNLREYLKINHDKGSCFIKLLAMSILHGNNSAFLSSYSHPIISLSPAEQQKINFQRAQAPEYRPLHPRILRKAAYVLREGIPSVLYSHAEFNSCLKADARNLNYLSSASIDLIVSRPPAFQLNKNPSKDQSWLKNWFAGYNEAGSSDLSPKYFENIETWKEFINEALMEMARVLKPGGRAVLEFSPIQMQSESYYTEDMVVELINENLGRFLEPEGVYIHKNKPARSRSEQSVDLININKSSRSLVIRRR